MDITVGLRMRLSESTCLNINLTDFQNSVVQRIYELEIIQRKKSLMPNRIK